MDGACIGLTSSNRVTFAEKPIGIRLRALRLRFLARLALGLALRLLARMALLAGVLPIVVVHACYVISVQAGIIPACIPYASGCTSISAAGRHGASYVLFKAGMIPAAKSGSPAATMPARSRATPSVTEAATPLFFIIPATRSPITAVAV